MTWHAEPEEDRDFIERGVGYEIKVVGVAIALTLLAIAVGLS